MGEELDKPTETGGASANNNGGQAGEPPAKQAVDPHIHELNKEAEKLRRERNTFRDELRAIKGQNEAILAEFEAEKQRREAAEAQAVKAAKTAMAIKFGLPEAIAERLKGNTPEEIEADAQALAELLPKPQQAPPPPGQASPGNPAGGGAQQTETDLSWLPGHPKYKGNTFRGGGVVVSPEK